MGLVSMKVTKSEAKEKRMETSISEEPEYPWGLNIRLDNDSLDKLKVDNLPEVGKEIMVMAKCVVSDVSQNQSLDGEKRRNVSLQITDMALASPDTGSTAEKLYGE